MGNLFLKSKCSWFSPIFVCLFVFVLALIISSPLSQLSQSWVYGFHIHTICCEFSAFFFLKCVKSNWPISVLRSDLEHRYSNNRCRLSSFFAHPTLALTAHHSRAIQCNHLSELSIESPFAGWIKWEPDVCWLPWTWSLCWLVLNSEPQMDLWTCNTRVNNNYN